MRSKVTTNDLQQRINQLEKENLDLKKEVEVLREAAEKYQTIFETVPTSIQVVDKNGIIIEVNPYHLEHMGRGKTTKQDYLNQPILSRPSIVRAGLIEKYRRVLAGEKMEEGEVHFPFTSGGVKDAYSNIRGAPIVRDGEVIGAIFISEDVTQLKKDHEELIRHREKLEELVAARTRDLQEAYRKLQEENVERQKAEEEKERIIIQLQEALARVKALSGLLPICASCKKIRDDDGYWYQVEVYIRDHAQVEFSHGICPECVKKLYPEFYSDSEKQ
jgi:PAS domain S-box-containing protein